MHFPRKVYEFVDFVGLCMVAKRNHGSIKYFVLGDKTLKSKGEKDEIDLLRMGEVSQ